MQISRCHSAYNFTYASLFQSRSFFPAFCRTFSFSCLTIALHWSSFGCIFLSLALSKFSLVSSIIFFSFFFFCYSQLVLWPIMFFCWLLSSIFLYFPWILFLFLLSISSSSMARIFLVCCCDWHLTFKCQISRHFVPRVVFVLLQFDLLA